MTKKTKKEPNIFTVTVHSIVSHSKDETNSKVGRMKMQHNNKNRVLDIYRLADLVSKGYSFHACKHDLNYYEPGQKKATIRNKSFVSTQIFAADVDHGNFTIADIKKMLNSCEVKLKPALIYETQSSREGDRRYRVVFISNRLVESADEFSKVQSYLMYVFSKDCYREHKVDVTCKDACRIFYTAREGGVLEVNDATIDTNKVLAVCDKLNIENVRKNIRKQAEDLFMVVENKPKTLIKKNAESKKPVILHEEEMSDEFEEFLINNLMGLKDELDLPESVDLFSGIEFINTLPLTKILDWNVDEMYSCLFHTDTNPSAHIVTDGITEVYKCFSCQEEMSEVYNTFEVLHRLFNIKHNHTYYDTQNLILALLGVELGTPYQREANKQLQFNNLIVNKWMSNVFSSDKHEIVFKYLKHKGWFYAYRETLQVGTMSISKEPVCNDESEKCATFFMSCRHLQKRLVDIRGHKSHRKVNEKLNALCKLGLLQKVAKQDIRKKYQARTDAQREKIVERLNQQFYKIALMEGKALGIEASYINPESVKDIDYYRIPYLSDAIIDQAIEMIKLDKDLNVTTLGFSQKQLALINPELADQIFRNNRKSDKTESKKGARVQVEDDSLLGIASKNKNIVLTKGDRHILKVADKYIDKWLSERDYFTSDELLRKIDVSRNYFKKKGSKEYAFKVLRPFILQQKELTSVTVKKETRPLYNIPDSISSNTKIFVKRK